MVEKSYIAADMNSFATVPVRSFKSGFNTNVNLVIITAVTDSAQVEILSVFDVEGNVLASIKVESAVKQIIKPQQAADMTFATVDDHSFTLF